MFVVLVLYLMMCHLHNLDNINGRVKQAVIDAERRALEHEAKQAELAVSKLMQDLQAAKEAVRIARDAHIESEVCCQCVIIISLFHCVLILIIASYYSAYSSFITKLTSIIQ